MRGFCGWYDEAKRRGCDPASGRCPFEPIRLLNQADDKWAMDEP